MNYLFKPRGACALESQLLKEPILDTVGILLLHDLLDLLAEVLLGLGGFSVLLVPDFFGICRDVEAVSGGEDMVDVVHLEEGSDSGAPGDLLLAHGFRHFQRGLGDAGDQDMRVRSLLSTLVVVLDDDGLLAGIPAAENNDHLSGLQNLHHL